MPPKGEFKQKSLKLLQVVKKKKYAKYFIEGRNFCIPRPCTYKQSDNLYKKLMEIQSISSFMDNPKAIHYVLNRHSKSIKKYFENASNIRLKIKNMVVKREKKSDRRQRLFCVWQEDTVAG